MISIRKREYRFEEWHFDTIKTVGSDRKVYICDTLYSLLSDYR